MTVPLRYAMKLAGGWGVVFFDISCALKNLREADRHKDEYSPCLLTTAIRAIRNSLQIGNNPSRCRHAHQVRKWPSGRLSTWPAFSTICWTYPASAVADRMQASPRQLPGAAGHVEAVRPSSKTSGHELIFGHTFRAPVDSRRPDQVGAG